MKLKLLEEVLIGDNPELNNLLNLSLKEIFNPFYLQRIESVIKKRIKLVPKEIEENKYAYTSGRSIYINKNILNKLNKRELIKILLHELTHVLQLKRRFFLFSKFRELNKVGRRLSKVIKQYASDPAYFLLGKNHKLLGSVNLPPQEILAYLMSGSIKWNGLKPPGKQLFIQVLKDSKIFNLNSNFWKERLR